MESAGNSICKERNLQGTELARNGGGICKEWTLQGMRTIFVSITVTYSTNSIS